MTTLANGDDNISDSASKEASDARLRSSAQSNKKLAKNISTPVTRWAIEA
jgi:hypothetical protein